MKIVFMGTPDFGVVALNKLIEAHEVILVVSQPDRKIGRKRILTPSPIKEVALENNIDVFQPENIKENYQTIIDSEPDIIITAAYGQFVPTQVLDCPKYGAINVHASLLPKYRGGSPIHSAIKNGDEYSGVSIMYMVKKMDAGDILSQVKVRIEKDDTALSMFSKLGLVGSDLLLETLISIEADDLTLTKQDQSLVTYAHNIKRTDEKINWNLTANGIDCHVRGYHSWPGTFTEINGQIIKIYPGQIVNKNGLPGEILSISNDGILVGSSELSYLITDFQVQGKKRMKIKDFLNGNKLLFVGDFFR